MTLQLKSSPSSSPRNDRYGFEQQDFAALTHEVRVILDGGGGVGDDRRFRSRALCARLLDIAEDRYRGDYDMILFIHGIIGQLQTAVGDQ